MKRGLLAALALAAAAAAARHVVLNAGSTKAERRRQLPGDAAIDGRCAVVTEAITIEAPPDAVWPWLLDMEAARGVVVDSDPEHALVVQLPVQGIRATTAYVLERDGDRTRLLVRTRVATRPRLLAPFVPQPPVRRRLRALARTAAEHYNASEGPVEVAGTA